MTEPTLRNDRHGPPDGVVIRALVWCEDRKPSAEFHYDHCICETAIGRFVLTWKSWKTDHWQAMGIGFDETPWGDAWYGGWDSIDAAKHAALEELNRRVQSLLI